MIIGINGEEVPVSPEQLHLVVYPNDMMNGLLINLPDQYGFVSEHDPERSVVIQAASDEGAEEYDLTDCDVDLEAVPHCWVVKSLSKLVIEAAEDLLEHA